MTSFDIVRIALDSMEEVVFIIDKESIIVYANPSTVAFFGVIIHEIIGKKCFEIFRKLNVDCFQLCPLKRANCNESREHIIVNTKSTLDEKLGTKTWKHYSLVFNRKVEGYLIMIEEFSQFPLVSDAQKKSSKLKFKNSKDNNNYWNSKIKFTPKTLILHEKSPSIANNDFSSEFSSLNKKRLKDTTEITKDNECDMAFHFVKLANLVKKQSISVQKIRLITEHQSKVTQNLLNHSKTFKLSSDE